MTHSTPFFEFALLLVIPGALLVLFAALLLTGRTWWPNRPGASRRPGPDLTHRFWHRSTGTVWRMPRHWLTLDERVLREASQHPLSLSGHLVWPRLKFHCRSKFTLDWPPLAQASSQHPSGSAGSLVKNDNSQCECWKKASGRERRSLCTNAASGQRNTAGI